MPRPKKMPQRHAGRRPPQSVPPQSGAPRRRRRRRGDPGVATSRHRFVACPVIRLLDRLLAE
ncbi:MAG: hypothetical protein AVDCRST_MAG08-2648 [uncultured Acetobacteraceae bacterium]|uniref:Uncharacterized protein n=1 Tax=uncultured Acetobacteraceae bacterium TaxID=169975 RepID=A0A6J4IVK4_9PROT|nr:MAG: hypothetical protein AVDCRST_MAG08-2648 [uncultured Acetobacteraceae bacterium]